MECKDISNFSTGLNPYCAEAMDFHCWGPRKKTIFIDGFDGGGSRGIMSAIIAAKIEELTKERFSNLFKVSAGTSVGSFIAAGLHYAKPEKSDKLPSSAVDTLFNFSDLYGDPYKASDMIELFEKETEHIFPPVSYLTSVGSIFWSSYKSTALDKVLNTYFQDLLLCQAKNTIYMPACEMATIKPCWFSNSKIEFTSYPKNKSVVKNYDEEFLKVKLFNVLKASSAAPTYFDPEEMTFNSRKFSFRDGGLFANNPSLYAYTETFKKYGHSCNYSIASFGTGMVSEESMLETKNNRGLYFWAKHSAAVIMEMTSRNTELQLQNLLPGEGKDQNLFVLQPEISLQDYTLGGSSKEHMQHLKDAAYKCIEDREEELKVLCNKLTNECDAEERVQRQDF